MNRLKKRVTNLLWLLGPFFVIVGVWQIVASLEIFPPFLFPKATKVFVTFFNYGRSGELFPHIWDSLIRLSLGFVVGFGIGFPLGIAMGSNRVIARAFDPVVNFFQAIPGLAWVPLAILWFGLGYKAVTFVIFTNVFFPVCFNTMTGVRGIPQVLINAASHVRCQLSPGRQRDSCFRSLTFRGYRHQDRNGIWLARPGRRRDDRGHVRAGIPYFRCQAVLEDGRYYYGYDHHGPHVALDGPADLKAMGIKNN